MAEAAAFVGAAMLLRALLARKVSLAAGVPLAVALLVALLAVPAVWGAMRGLDGVRDGLILAPGINEREKCLVDGGSADVVGLARFVVKRVPPDARLLARGVPQVCFQLAVLPRKVVRADQAHDYTVYWNDVPAAVRARVRAEAKLDPATRTTDTYGRRGVLVRER